MAETNTFVDETARWSAVVDCDATADGQFVYSVKTTGIYCRPSCRSRTPRRDNVAFHLSPAAAELSGYRPCKRCNPEKITQTSGAKP